MDIPYSNVLRQNWWQLGLCVIGISLLIAGIVATANESKSEIVDIIAPSAQPNAVDQTKKEVVVDVAGSVENPGVYRLPQESRIGEAIIAAGGLAKKADRSYVARFINQAQLVTDGMKVYIPEQGEKTGQITSSESLTANATSNQTGIISINSASQAELETLWGIGEARAQAIITNRPYSSVDELQTKANVPKNVIERNKTVLGL